MNGSHISDLKSQMGVLYLDGVSPSYQRQVIRRQHRIQHLLAVASRLFCDKGYEATTLGMIAGEMGLSKTGLYNYVGSKEEIAALIMEGAIQHLSEALEGFEQQFSDPRHVLSAIIVEQVESLVHHPAGPLLIMHFDQMLDLDRFSGLYAMRRRYEMQLRQVIERGIQQGTFAVNDAKLGSLFLLGAVNWVARWFPGEDAELAPQARDIGQWFAQVIVGGLCSPVLA